MSEKHMVVFTTGHKTRDIQTDSITHNSSTGNKHFSVSREDGDYLKSIGYTVVNQGTWSVVVIKPYDEPHLILGVYPIISGVAVGKPKNVDIEGG